MSPAMSGVEGDYSQLAFFAVLAAVQGDLAIHGVSGSSAQGDRQILSILHDFGASLQPLDDGFLIHRGSLKAAPVDLNDCPDLGPILFVLAAMAEGTTQHLHAGRLRIKESDRIAAMEEELRKFGVRITSDEDNVWIEGRKHALCLRRNIIRPQRPSRRDGAVRDGAVQQQRLHDRRRAGHP